MLIELVGADSSNEMAAEDDPPMHLGNRKILVVLSAAFLLYGVVLAVGSRAGFPERMRNGISFPYLCDKPVGEDGYYMLNVAWNLAHGEGVVYNYHEPTAGVQPLSTFVFSALAGITQRLHGDKWTFVRVIMLFGVLNQLLLAYLVANLTAAISGRRELPEFLASNLGFLLTLFNITLFRWTTYGLETGLYLTLLSLCVLFSLAMLRSPQLTKRQALTFGALTGLTGLARIDFGVILFFFLALSLWQKRLRVGSTMIIGCTAALFVAPWMIFTHSISGSWMPSSGKAQAKLVAASDALPRALGMAQAVIGHLTPWIYPINLRVAIAGLTTLLIFLLLLMPPREAYTLLQGRMRDNPHLLNWLLSILGLLFVYFLFFWDAHFYGRYSSPLLIVTFPLLAIVVAEGIKDWPRVMRTAAIWGMPVCFAVWAFLCFHLGRVGNTLTIEAGFVREHFSEERVGVFQSGVVGYFNPNVINLDGKVNHLALLYQKQNKLDAYVDLRGIQVLVDWPGYIYHNLNQSWLQEKWKPCEEGNPYNELGVENSICLKRSLQ